jgi:anti-sigma-K factor RskA
MTCDELRDDYELYVFGALEQPARGEIDGHLSRACPNCTAGVKRAQEIAGCLALTVPAADPPDRLRKRVLASVAPDAKPRSRWAGAWVAVAACLAVTVVAMMIRDRQKDAELKDARRHVQEQRVELARLTEALTILNDPAAKQVVFGGAVSQPPRGRVFVHPQRGVVLIASNLPPVPPGKTYEMWVIPRTGSPAPAGLFRSEPDGTALHVLRGGLDLASTGAIAVTVEPEGGTAQPTSKPLIVAAL